MIRYLPFFLLTTCLLHSQNCPIDEPLAHETTDVRIQTFEKLLVASPTGLKLQSGLVSAYLQKVRETSDFGYLARASKIVDRILEKDGGSSTRFVLKTKSICSITISKP